jgi:hypothetical protein
MSWTKDPTRVAEDDTPISRLVSTATPSSSSSIKKHLDDAFYGDVEQERQQFAQDMDKHISHTYAANVDEEMAAVTRSVEKHVRSVEETVQQCQFFQTVELHKIAEELHKVSEMVAINDNIRRQFVRIFEVEQEAFQRYESERRDTFRRDLASLYSEYGIADDAAAFVANDEHEDES